MTLSGGRSSDSATVKVTNAAPTITSAAGPKTPVSAGKPALVTAAFGDPGAGDTHTCEIDWKDGGRPTAGKVTATGCRAEHTYTEAGIHRPVVTVTDDDGASDSTTLAELIVYDRAAGAATGDGGFTSPAGKATFSFTAKYNWFSTTPTGKAAFDFDQGKQKFRSTASDWLVVTGSTAVYQGTGTVNGQSGYAFRITATDGPDTFKIKIWKKSTGTVLYENTNAAETKGITIGRS